MTLHAAVQAQHERGEAPIVTARTDGVGELQKARMPLRLPVAEIERALERGGLQGLGAVLVGDPEIRGELRHVTELPQQGGAETVDSPNLRPAAESALAAQVPVAGVL